MEILKKFNYSPGQNNGANQRNQTKLDKTRKTAFAEVLTTIANALILEGRKGIRLYLHSVCTQLIQLI